jgi:hypothetical protein
LIKLQMYNCKMMKHLGSLQKRIILYPTLQG